MFRTPRDASIRRVLRAAFVCLGVAMGIATVPLSMGNTGCATTPVLKGPGEPCTRSNECQSALTCTSGVCRAEPGVDAAVPHDAGSDASSAGDASTSLDAGAVDGGVEAVDAFVEVDAVVGDDAFVDQDAP